MIFSKNKNVQLILAFLTCIIGNTQCMEYKEGKCYCFKEQDHTLANKYFGYGLPMKYEYTGVKPISQTLFEPCQCNDVTRIRTPYVFLDKAVQDQVKNNESIAKLEKSVLYQIEHFAENETSFHMAEVTYDKTDGNDTSLTVEIILKGHETSVPNLVSEIMINTSQTLNSDFGMTDEGKFNYTILQCLADPPAESTYGQRNWTVSGRNGYPGEIATYTCDENYVLEDMDMAFSKCSHDNFEWTDPGDNINCSKGCNEAPPRSPALTQIQWTKNNNKIGSVALYTCIPEYKSVTGSNGTSICYNNQWTNVTANFTCERVLCPKQVPKNVAHGVISGFNESASLIYKTTLVYSCMDKFCSNYDEDLYVHCLIDGTWSKLPEDYNCFRKTRAYCLTKKIQQMMHQEYLNSKKKIPDTVYFLTATIPFIIALGVLLLFAITIVRLDSPLYWCCSSKARKQNYRLDQY